MTIPAEARQCIYRSIAQAAANADEMGRRRLGEGIEFFRFLRAREGRQSRSHCRP